MFFSYIRYKSGYIVYVYIIDNNEHLPLRNFGEMQSAAIEFRNFINNNNMESDVLKNRIIGLAKTYNPNDYYYYPEIKNDKKNFSLKKQKI